MPPKTPHFWQHDSLISKFLTPFSNLYDIGQKMDVFFTASYKSKLPVLCVGGVVAGGSGKTPVLQSLLYLLRDHGLFSNPAIITRGYGGKIKKSTVVDPHIHTYHDVGDEALLHARHATTIVGRNRMESAMLAESLGADFILMDDGLQNNKLEKTASVLVIDGVQGLGNGKLLPAGPLRQSLPDVLGKVCMVIEVGQSNMFFPQTPVMASSVQVVSSHDESLSYVGFAGLGYPEKFRQTLVGNGFSLKDFVSFADHHPYTEQDLRKVHETADDARLITTAKDYVRIPANLRDGIDVLDIAVVFDKPDQVAHIIRECMGKT